MKTRKKYLGDLIRKDPKTALILEISSAGELVLSTENEEETPCPCDGDITLITPNGGCEWGSTECPDNTVAPPEPDSEPAPCSARAISVSGKPVVKMRLVGERRELAARLLGKLVK